MSLTFLRAMARDPHAVGSIWPSSPALARALVGAAGLRPGGHVVELGAGIGPMTRLLVGHDGPVLSLEPDPILAARARQAAPGVEVVEALAQDLPALVAERGWPGVDHVVSGLPFAIWGDSEQAAVLDALDAVARPGARFATFTYAHSPKLPAGRRFRHTLERRYGAVSVSPIVWACVPPSLVYRVTLRSRTPA